MSQSIEEEFIILETLTLEFCNYKDLKSSVVKYYLESSDEKPSFEQGGIIELQKFQLDNFIQIVTQDSDILRNLIMDFAFKIKPPQKAKRYLLKLKSIILDPNSPKTLSYENCQVELHGYTSIQLQSMLELQWLNIVEAIDIFMKSYQL